MIKIVSLVPPVAGPRSYLMHQFFDNMTSDFIEVDSTLEADAFFAHVNTGGTGANIYLKGFNLNDDKINLNNINADMFRQIEVLRQIPGILYFDAFGTGYGDTEYPDFVRDIDIVTAPVDLPPHPNYYRTHFVDERRFHPLHRFERRKKDVLILPDHIGKGGMPEALANLFKKGLIDRLLVRSEGIEHIERVYSVDVSPLYAHKAQIEFISQVGWSQGVRDLCNKIGFHITALHKGGVELMGVEAGMCGAQPIYPGTPYYRDMYKDTYVALFDIDNPVESLEAIFSQGYTWSKEKRLQFVDRCSGVRNLPGFWEHVKDILSRGTQ